jgi:hypothetical protein
MEVQSLARRIEAVDNVKVHVFARKLRRYGLAQATCEKSARINARFREAAFHPKRVQTKSAI